MDAQVEARLMLVAEYLAGDNKRELLKYKAIIKSIDELEERFERNILDFSTRELKSSVSEVKRKHPNDRRGYVKAFFKFVKEYSNVCNQFNISNTLAEKAKSVEPEYYGAINFHYMSENQFEYAMSHCDDLRAKLCALACYTGLENTISPFRIAFLSKDEVKDGKFFIKDLGNAEYDPDPELYDLAVEAGNTLSEISRSYTRNFERNLDLADDNMILHSRLYPQESGEPMPDEYDPNDARMLNRRKIIVRNKLNIFFDVFPSNRNERYEARDLIFSGLVNTIKAKAKEHGMIPEEYIKSENFSEIEKQYVALWKVKPRKLAISLDRDKVLENLLHYLREEEE